MLRQAHKRRAPLLILAGQADKGVRPRFHSIGGGAPFRYQDDGAMSAEHLRKMAGLLKAGGFPVEFREVPGRHYAPFPADQVQAAWGWLKTHRTVSGCSRVNTG